MAFSIRLTEQEKSLAESYAKLHSISLSEAFKSALFDRIENEYDIFIADREYNKYVSSGCKSTPISDFWKEIDE